MMMIEIKPASAGAGFNPLLLPKDQPIVIFIEKLIG
jgi:hypothetical protein